MTRSHQSGDLPQLCEPLASGLGLIERAMVLRDPYGYIVPGAKVTISARTVERLEALGLVCPHPEYGRKTMEPTALGLRTLVAREGCIRPMICDQQAAGRWNGRSVHEAAPASGQSVRSRSHRSILQALGETTGALLAQWQAIRMRLTRLHASPERPAPWSRWVLPFDHGADLTSTQPARFLRLLKLRRRTS